MKEISSTATSLTPHRRHHHRATPNGGGGCGGSFSDGGGSSDLLNKTLTISKYFGFVRWLRFREFMRGESLAWNNRKGR
jgi:hypothetical protein